MSQPQKSDKEIAAEILTTLLSSRYNCSISETKDNLPTEKELATGASNMFKIIYQAVKDADKS